MVVGAWFDASTGPSGSEREGRCGQAGIERLHGVAVTVGMAEEDFEGRLGSGIFTTKGTKEHKGLFFEFEQAHIFQVHGTTCRSLG